MQNRSPRRVPREDDHDVEREQEEKGHEHVAEVARQEALHPSEGRPHAGLGAASAQSAQFNQGLQATA